MFAECGSPTTTPNESGSSGSFDLKLQQMSLTLTFNPSIVFKYLSCRSWHASNLLRTNSDALFHDGTS